VARRLRFHEKAAEEIAEAARWYGERGAAYAVAFRLDLNQAVALIARYPDRWPIHASRARRFVLRRFPFSLVYRVDSDQVTVVALAHHRRRPAYWRRRD
jgi:plasmid stabilization system protein ParE